MNECYGNDIEFVSISTQEYKVDVVKILREAYVSKSDEVLFVDNLVRAINLRKQHYIATFTSDIHSI